MADPNPLSRRAWLKAAGLSALSLDGVLALPPARQALARALEPSPVLNALRLSGPWINSPPLDAAALRGKVVVVCFWTYSCINSLRALPYLRAWRARYGERLAIVGVHTPEFVFEADTANVRQALTDLSVDFPVVLDSERRIWSAFGNNAWPSFHFIGADGRTRGHVDGEGGYDACDRRIQELLAEVPGPAAPTGPTSAIGRGPEAAADWNDLGSGESYVGYGQAQACVSPGGLRPDREHSYRAPDRLPLNGWGLTGAWTAGREFATATGPAAGLVHRFHARDLHMVLAPSDRPVRFRVTLDGAAPGEDHGWDVAADGSGVVDRPRMHQLVRQAGPITDRTFQIEFLDPGARAYVFTFG